MITFKYRLKSLLKDTSLIFWTLIFPMLLATFFNFTLRNAFAPDTLEPIPVAIVETQDATFNDFIETLSTDYDVIDPTYVTTSQEAETLLSDERVIGYIENKDALTLTVSSSSLNATILDTILNEYTQRIYLIESSIQEDPQLLETSFITDILEDNNYVTTSENSKSDNIYVIYFYTTIAMLCLYTAEWGQKSGEHLQADKDPLAIRTNISPTPKWKLLMMDVSAVYFIFVIEFLIHFSFLKFILKMPFGTNIGLIFLSGFAGGFMSICIGYAVSVLVRGDHMKGALISYAGLLSSFLSGMMSIDLKRLLERMVPFLAYINPATLITDNFYFLYYYTDTTRVYINILMMLLIGLIFSYIAYRKLKVVSYDHL